MLCKIGLFGSEWSLIAGSSEHGFYGSGGEWDVLTSCTSIRPCLAVLSTFTACSYLLCCLVILL